MTPPETGSTTTPGAPRATAPPPRTFGPQGPTLGDLSDAYLQDYQVRQFRSHNTARGRVAHLIAFFGRAAQAAALTTHQIRQYQLARCAAGAATGTINRETSALHRMGTLAVHWGWLDTVPGFPDRLRENPPRQGFFEHPEYRAVRAHLPAPWAVGRLNAPSAVQNGLFNVTGGSIEKASRLTPGKNNGWAVRILPSGLGDVTVRINGTTACNTAPGVCTADGRTLDGGLSVSSAGPAVSVADAEVEEGADATVTHSDAEGIVTLTKSSSIDPQGGASPSRTRHAGRQKRPLTST